MPKGVLLLTQQDQLLLSWTIGNATTGDIKEATSWEGSEIVFSMKISISNLRLVQKTMIK